MAVRQISTELALSGEKEFNSAMKSVNNNLRTLKSDMAATSAEFDDNSNSVTALTAKNKILQDTYDQQKEKQAALAAMLKKVEEAYGADSAQADKYRQQLNQTTVAVKKAEDALKANSAELAKHPPLLGKVSDAFNSAKKKVTDFAQDHITAAKKTKVLGDAIFVVEHAVSGAATAVKAGGKVIEGALSGTAKTAAALTAAGAAAAGVMATLAVTGLKTLTDYAVQAAERGDPAFSWLKTNLDGFKAASESAQAALGGILLPVLSELAGEGGQLLNDFAADMAAASGDTQKQSQVITQYITRAAGLIRAQLPQIMHLAADLISGLGEGLIENAPQLLDDAQAIIEQLLDGIIDGAPQIGEGAVELIGKLAETLLSLAPEVLQAGIELVTDLVQGLAQAAPELIPAAVDLIVQLVTTLVTNAPLLLEAGLELLLALIQGVLEAVPQLIAQAPVIIDGAVKAFEEQAPKMIEVGKNIIEGIKKGIEAAKDALFSKLKDIAQKALQAAKDALGIESPSKVFRDEVGVYMAQGIGVGFEKEMSLVNKSIARSIQTRFNIAPAVLGSNNADTGSVKSGIAGRIANVTINSHQLTQADFEAILDYIERHLL